MCCLWPAVHKAAECLCVVSGAGISVNGSAKGARRKGDLMAAEVARLGAILSAHARKFDRSPTSWPLLGHDSSVLGVHADEARRRP
jgi:hypothetical protein